MLTVAAAVAAQSSTATSQSLASGSDATATIVSRPPPPLRVVGQLLWRCLELLRIFFPFLGCFLLRKIPLIGERAASRAQLHALLISGLAHAGPVGIKWAQWASTRYDLFDDDLCQALGTLTNHAPAHAFSWSRQLIETSFSARLDDLFDEVSEVPFASGSIGQVHVARLKSDGTRVAIKVQHPHLAGRLQVDMALMRKAADTLSRLAPGLRVEQMVEQFTNNFEMQLNFEDEARNLRSFRSHFDSPFWSALVSYPRPIEGLVSPLVLVETFEEGESVATFLERKGALEEGKWRLAANGRWEMVGGTTLDEDSVIRQSISLCGVQALLKMCIWDNLIHADLHPGNVLIRMDEIGLIARLQRWLVLGDASSRVPHIVLLDAGLAASFNPAIFAHVRMFFDAVVDDDGEKYGEAILGLAESQPHVRSPEAFKQEVWQKNLRQKEEFNSGGGRAGQNIRDYLASVREHNVVIDPTVMVSLMSMMVLEGWQTRLDPAVCIFDCLQQARSSGAFGMAERVHLAYKHAYKATCGRLFSN